MKSNKDDQAVINGQIFKLLITRRQIINKVRQFAKQIAIDYADSDKPPILLFVLTGGLYLGIDLTRELSKLGFLYHVDTVGLKRYAADQQGGLVQIISSPHSNMESRDVIVVEDLIDIGDTMNFLHRYLIGMEHPPKSVEYCTMLIKSCHKELDFSVRYLGSAIGPDWVVGNGMDSEQAGRGLLGIYVKVS